VFPLQKLRNFQPGLCQGDVSCLYIKPADLLCKAAISSMFFWLQWAKTPWRFRLPLLVLSQALGGLVLDLGCSRPFEKVSSKGAFFSQSPYSKRGVQVTQLYILYTCVIIVASKRNILESRLQSLLVEDGLLNILTVNAVISPNWHTASLFSVSKKKVTHPIGDSAQQHPWWPQYFSKMCTFQFQYIGCITQMTVTTRMTLYLCLSREFGSTPSFAPGILREKVDPTSTFQKAMYNYIKSKKCFFPTEHRATSF